MSVPVLIGFAGVLVAAVATGMLAGRCVRQPRIGFVLWTAATLGLTIALAAQSMGFASGFGPATFRAVQLSAILLAPLWLAWGLVELAVANDTARFGMRLISSALTVVASVILATDPLAAQPFSKAWPLTGPHFQPISHYALDAVQAVAVLAVVASAAVTAAGASRGSGPPVAAVGPAGLAVLMTAGQRFPLPAGAAYPLLSMAAAALVWFGASRVGELPRRAAGRDARRDGRREGVRDGRDRPGDQPGDDYWPDGRAAGDYVPEGGYATYGHRAGRPGPGRPPGDLPGTGPLGRSGPQPRAPERPDRYRRPGPGGPAADERPPGAPVHGGPVQGGPVQGGEAAAAEFGPSAGAAGSAAAAPARPYGRILIFTLLDDRVADFDRLAEEAAEQVRTGEPDTLVYVIHLVPNAPMQRIFYEIYRDRAAFDSHESQPYMQRFVAERRSCVLATNVIELRLKYAKVAPLPNPQAAATAASPLLPPPPAPLPPGPPQRPQPLPAGPPGGARRPQAPSGPQRPQPLPPARPQRPDQPRYDQPRYDQGRPDQRQLPSAGRQYGG